jgi:flavin reductase (DIM6/NTAB) family NADH-FMN oxidoreductase RutF
LSDADSADVAGGLRAAMRGVAATVIAIATRDATGARHGIVATSVTSLSFAPPSLLACINTSSSIAPHLDVGTCFSANVLRAEHESLSRTFSDQAQRASRFTDHAWVDDERGVPYLQDAQSTILCQVTEAHAYGTHTIAIGNVYRVINSTADASPLLYIAGGYTALAHPR